MAMQMTVRAASTIKPSLPPSNKIQLKPAKLFFFPTSTSLSLLTLFSNTLNANAITLPKDQLVSSLTQVEQTIDQVQQVGSDVLEKTQQVFKTLTEALKPGIDAAAPYVQQAGQEALKAASPVISEAAKKAQEAMQGSGITTESVSNAAKTVTSAAEQTSKVIDDVRPIASSTVETITNSDPALIVNTAAGLFLAYLLLPSVCLHYSGELTPAQTLDMLCSQNYYLIDIRSEKDKNKAGIPQLPPSAKSRIIAIPLEEIPSKLKNQVKSTKKVEAEIVALKISFLKRLNKGSNIVIMDSYSDFAKIAAKTLTSLGFKNSWIMSDGFSGGKGWSQSRLGTESYNLSFAEIFTPSRIIPGRTGTISSTTQTTRRLLPGSK
ncbi:hypothetical protein KSS87_005270 [Heliosperma pusillum]|nr:hypothetical protein KSS87_005270 [Heliosperma pusillum]